MLEVSNVQIVSSQHVSLKDAFDVSPIVASRTGVWPLARVSSPVPLQIVLESECFMTYCARMSPPLALQWNFLDCPYFVAAEDSLDCSN